MKVNRANWKLDKEDMEAVKGTKADINHAVKKRRNGKIEKSEATDRVYR